MVRIPFPTTVEVGMPLTSSQTGHIDPRRSERLAPVLSLIEFRIRDGMNSRLNAAASSRADFRFVGVRLTLETFIMAFARANRNFRIVSSRSIEARRAAMAFSDDIRA